MEELYRQGLSGDEEAQLDFITFIVTETELPMPDMAEVWLRRLAEKGNDQARRCYFSWAMAGGGGENHDWLKVEQWLLGMEAETPGAAHAMLGMLYDPAFPGFTDWKLAAQYYRNAVDAGNAGCGFYLARVYRGHGEEAGVSHEEMRELLERAEPVNACGQLYELLCASCEVLKDYDTAMKYYKRWRKYDPEDSGCCIGLACNYAMGRGVKRDFEIAFRYYQKAANLGDSYGMHMVGVMYYDGLGVRRNYKRAVDYFRRALEHGETQALYYLGTCYRDGLGVRQDVDRARQYLAEGIKDGVSECHVAQAMLELDEAATLEALDRVAPLLEKARTMLDDDDEEMRFQLELLEGAFEIKREKITAGVSADESGKC